MVEIVNPQDAVRVDLDLKLSRIRNKWLRVCGPCDAGLPGECTHPDEDYRTVIADLVTDLEKFREHAAADEPLYTDFSWGASGADQTAELSSDPDRPLFRLDVERLREFVGMAADTLDFLDECRLGKQMLEANPATTAEPAACICPTWREETPYGPQTMTGHDATCPVCGEKAGAAARQIGKTAASEAWIAEQEAAGHTVLRVGTTKAEPAAS